MIVSPGVLGISFEDQRPSDDQFTKLVAKKEGLPEEFQEHLKSCRRCRRDGLDYQRDHEMQHFQRISAWLLSAVLLVKAHELGDAYNWWTPGRFSGKQSTAVD